MKSKNDISFENDQFELVFAFKNCNIQPFFEPDCVSDEDQEIDETTEEDSEKGDNSKRNFDW